MVSVAVRNTPVVFGASSMVAVPEPLPLAAVTVSHGALLSAVHAHPVRRRHGSRPDPPEAARRWLAASPATVYPSSP